VRYAASATPYSPVNRWQSSELPDHCSFSSQSSVTYASMWYLNTETYIQTLDNTRNSQAQGLNLRPRSLRIQYSGVARIWRWVAQGVWGTEVPQRGPGAEPLVSGSGGIASRKLIAVIKDIWRPNHAQFCVFSSTAHPGIFLRTQFRGGGVPPIGCASDSVHTLIIRLNVCSQHMNWTELNRSSQWTAVLNTSVPMGLFTAHELAEHQPS